MKILLLHSREPILVTLKAAFERLGHQVFLIDDSPDLFSTLRHSIETFKPDVLITNNFDFMLQAPDADAIEEHLKRKGLLSISWFFESPEIAGGSQFLGRWIQNRYPRHFVIATTDTFFLDFYKGHGLEAFYLPMGVSRKDLPTDDILSRSQASSSGADTLLFVGAPVSGGIDKQYDDEALRAFYINWALNDLEHIRGLPLSASIEETFQSQLETLFHLSSRFDGSFRVNRRSWSQAHAHLQKTDIDRIVWSIFGSRLDYLFSGYQLAQTLRGINRKINLEVHGGPEWSVLIPELKNRPERLTNEQVFAAMRSHSATLCVTKQTFQRFIHERVWMIFGQGGFPIADEREDLWRFFERHDIATYRSAEEIPLLFEFYRKNADIRNKMILKGREMVLRDHTYDTRAQQLIDHIHRLQNSKPRPLTTTPPLQTLASDQTIEPDPN